MLRLGRALSPLVLATQKAAGWVAMPVRTAVSTTATDLTKKGSRGGGQQWWQPVLPALAAQMCPNEKGKGRGLRNQQKKRQQVVSMHTRRKEGARRSNIKRMTRWLDTKEKIQRVYHKYATMLQQKALASKGFTDPQNTDNNGGIPPCGEH